MRETRAQLRQALVDERLAAEPLRREVHAARRYRGFVRLGGRVLVGAVKLAAVAAAIMVEELE